MFNMGFGGGMPRGGAGKQRRSYTFSFGGGAPNGGFRFDL